MDKGNAVGFSPCMLHRPAIGKEIWEGWQGLTPNIDMIGFIGPTEVVPLLQNRSRIAIRAI
jgi:hypothetical protein